MSVDLQPKSAPKLPACADCKRLKVKCVRSDPNVPNSTCLRCMKKGIDCVLRTGSKRLNNGYERDPTISREIPRKRRNPQTESLSREHFNSLTMRDQVLSSWKQLTSRDDLRLQLLEKAEPASLARPANNILRRGLMSREQIVRRLRLYRQEFYPKYPAVICPVEDDFDAMMNEKPILFHTFLDIGSMMIQDENELQPSLILHNLVLRTVIDEIMLVSIKNIELLNCLVLLTHWYNESELYHQQRLHVLNALAISVSYDLGIGGTAIITSGSSAPAFEQMVAPQTSADIHSPESYRIWLSVYSTLFQSLLANRRPVNSLWNNYSKQAVATLSRQSVLHMADEQYFSVWELAQLRHLQERISITIFKKDNEPSAPDLSNPEIRCAVEQFDAELDAMRDSVAKKSIRRDTAIRISRIFLHQAALYIEFDKTIGRAPFTNFSLKIHSGPLSFQAKKSFAACVENTKILIDRVNSQPLREIASETSNFWTSMTLCCDILLKCRACCIFNRYYANACFVSDVDIYRILQFTSLCDRMTKEYPHCNNAISFGFFVKLILCHHDARVHYHSTRLPVETFGDPVFIMKLANAVQEQTSQAMNGLNNASYEAEQDVPTPEKQMLEQQREETRREQQRKQQQLEQRLELQYNRAQAQAPSQQSQEPQAVPIYALQTPDTPGLNQRDLSRNLTNNGAIDSISINQDAAAPGVLSPFSPVAGDSVSRQENSQQQTTQDQDVSGDLFPPLDLSGLDFDLAALNEADAFWSDFVNTRGPWVPFGIDFPV